MERLKRDSLGISQGTPRITDTRSTDEIKRYASTLETCGKVHAMRVDGLQRDFTDLNENLERVAKGKRVAKRRPDPDEETEADDPDGPRDVANVRRAKEREAVPTRKARKPRKSHVVQNKELACPETEMNANVRRQTLLRNGPQLLRNIIRLDQLCFGTLFLASFWFFFS